jgi:hypothetical protein
MRYVWCALTLALLLAGCGYVGDPLPPALNIPAKVTDLSAVQRAATIEISFTAPALTTEELGIREFGGMELRIGPLPDPFSYEAWAASAQPVEAAIPEPGKPVHATFPASTWAGREVMVAVRFASTRGRQSDWSNQVLLTPRSPLQPPTLRTEAHPEGIRVLWQPVVEGATYRIERNGEAAGEVQQAEFVDRGTELGKSYRYRVQVAQAGVESEWSKPAEASAVDKFAPQPPTGLSAIAGLETIELTWDPGPEKDIGGYRVYRSLGEAPFTVVGDSVPTPVFSDRSPAASGVHRYRITAIDRTGNESAPSAVAEISR